MLRLWSSVLCCSVWQIAASILEETAASVFRGDNVFNRLVRMWVPICHTSQPHILEDCNTKSVHIDSYRVCVFWNVTAVLHASLALMLRKMTNIYEGQSHVNFKSTITIWTTARLSVSWQQWYWWFEEWPTGGSGDYVEKWSHCVPFVFSKLWDKKYLRFSFDSPSYIQGGTEYHWQIWVLVNAIINISSPLTARYLVNYIVL